MVKNRKSQKVLDKTMSVRTIHSIHHNILHYTGKLAERVQREDPERSWRRTA